MEFDDVMKSLVDEKDVPKELNLKLKKKIKAKYNYTKLIRSIPLSAVACIAVGIVLVSAVNQNEEKFVQPNNVVSEIIISEEIYVEEEKPEKIEEKKLPVVKKTKTETVIEPPIEEISIASVEEIGIEAYSNEEIETYEQTPMSRGRMIEEDIKPSLIEYLNNDEEKIFLITQRIIEQMIDNEEIEYYDTFNSISGDERYDLTEENELIIFVDAGVIAPEEYGEQIFNVGFISE